MLLHIEKYRRQDKAIEAAAENIKKEAKIQGLNQFKTTANKKTQQETYAQGI